MEIRKDKTRAFSVPFILSKGKSCVILSKGKICVLSQCIVYWIHFQNMHTFTYQKTLLHTLLLLVCKIVSRLVCKIVSLSQGYRATMRRHFTFCYSVPRSSWYSNDQNWKNERLSWPWKHLVVFNLGPLDWESSALTGLSIRHTQLHSCRQACRQINLLVQLIAQAT